MRLLSLWFSVVALQGKVNGCNFHTRSGSRVNLPPGEGDANILFTGCQLSAVVNRRLSHTLYDLSLMSLRKWHPTPVFLPGKSQGWRSLVGYSPWSCKEFDTTGRLHFHFLFLEGLTAAFLKPLPGTTEGPGVQQREKQMQGDLREGTHLGPSSGISIDW